MTNLTEMLEKIEIEKKLLSVMPKNNGKDISKYLEKIQQLNKEYTEIQESIKKIFIKRYEKAIKVKESNELENLEIRINTIEKILYLLNNDKTSYEKMELDKIIYKISKYYKGNLENINEQIEQAINKFNNVGINLEVSDFNYSIYVQQYMKVFFEELGKGNTNTLKNKFEEIYWKCPDIIIHIELNIRNIYLNKQAQIDKYFEKEKNKLLKQWERTTEQIKDSYFDIKKQKIEKIAQDKKILLDKFLDGKLNIKDYSQDNIKSNYSKILAPSKLEANQEEIEKGIFEFLNSLYEYKNYLYFKFIIDDLKKHYSQKENYKKIYDDTKKKIIDKEKKLKKINKKITSKGLFGKKKEIKQTTEQNQLIVEIKKLYKELDINKFYNKIYSNLEDNSSLYDALNLANSYYNYLTNCMIENNKVITPEKIDEQIEKLDEFLKSPYNNIISNITITDEKDIAMIIKDRYKLLSFNIEKEDFSVKSIDGLITTLENIVTSIGLNKSGIEVEKVEEILALKGILE